MSLVELMGYPDDCPEAVDQLRQRAHQQVDRAISFCLSEHVPLSFLDFEIVLRDHVGTLALILIQLYLFRLHRHLDLSDWLARGYRVADSYAPRLLKTTFGHLSYARAYLIPCKGRGRGVHPLDALLGLTRDSFSPLLISHFTRLATRMSYALASQLGGALLGWAPPPSAIEEWALGLGRPAYLWHSEGPLPEGDGEVLVMEFDGKAAPTATEEELNKRRGKRQDKPKACECNCKRHRGRCCRKTCGKKKKRKRGNKSKNGRSAVLVAMYTLKRGSDGRLHGPINKKVFATFSCRAKALLWAQQQAARRGFGPDSGKEIQVVVDGEVCLEQQVRKLFPKAIVTLDIRHAQERLWQVGRLVHEEGSEELAGWVEPLAELLVSGKIEELLEKLGEPKFAGPGSKKKREVQRKAIAYLKKRGELMKYDEWRKKDLVLASGVVEGAARYVIGERLDNSGMRWVVDKAECLLLLRCIEVNGDWEDFFQWTHQQRQKELQEGKVVQIRSQTPTQLPEENPQSVARRRRRAEATTAEHAKEVA